MEMCADAYAQWRDGLESGFESRIVGALSRDEEGVRFAVGTAVRHSAFEAFGSDIDPRMVEIAKENARRAGVGDCVKIFCADATKITKPDRRGTIVTNPPYGERLGSLKEAEDLYRAMGKAFSALAPYQIYVLTSHEGFERFYGKKADKVRKLYNGMLPCYFYQYFKNK